MSHSLPGGCSTYIRTDFPIPTTYLYYVYFSPMAASSARSSSSHESASTAASTAPYAGSSGEALPLRLSLAGGEPGASRREPTWLGLGRGRDEPA